MLVPIVLWATAALYAVEVCRMEYCNRRWIVLGFVNGAIASTVCLIHGLLSFSFKMGGFSLWLLVPLYVSLWYIFRSIQLAKSSCLDLPAYEYSFLGTMPLWILSVIASQRFYANLPDHPPSCFVVTAASRGHDWLVGPFSDSTHGGQARKVNAQLATLLELERRWKAFSPATHRSFRRIYNVIGPLVASAICNPWIADAVYFLIKPVELVAAMVIKFRAEKGGNV